MYRRLTAVAVIVALCACGPARAWADGTGDAFTGDGQVGAIADDGGTAATPKSGGGGPSACSYQKLSDSESQSADALWSRSSSDGAWYRKICNIGNGQTQATVVWLASPAVDPAVLAQEALQRTPIPVPAVHLNPPEGQDQVVNLSTWLWIDPNQWQSVSATAAAGAVTVTAVAAPQSVEWDMGNGDVVTCDGPGTPYDDSKPSSAQTTDCSYTYRASSASRPDGAFTVTVTVTWGVTWSAAGIAGGGNLGPTQQSTSFPVRVAEIQAVNR